MRDSLNKAPELSDSAVVDFASHAPCADRKWRTEALLEVANKLGKQDLNFSMTLGEIKHLAAKAGDQHLLSRIADTDDLVWTLPQGERQAAQQEGLFA